MAWMSSLGLWRWDRGWQMSSCKCSTYGPGECKTPFTMVIQLWFDNRWWFWKKWSVYNAKPVGICWLSTFWYYWTEWNLRSETGSLPPSSNTDCLWGLTQVFNLKTLSGLLLQPIATWSHSSFWVFESNGREIWENWYEIQEFKRFLTLDIDMHSLHRWLATARKTTLPSRVPHEDALVSTPLLTAFESPVAVGRKCFSFPATRGFDVPPESGCWAAQGSLGV